MRKIFWIKIVFSVAVFVGLCVLGMLSLIGFSFQSHHDYKRNSIEYILLFDSEIGDIPLVKTNADALFTSLPQDGTSRSVAQASIAVADIALASGEIESHLIKLGYAAVIKCEPICGKTLLKGDASVSIYPEKSRLSIVKMDY